MIGACHRDVHQPGDQQPQQADRTGGADMDTGDPLLLDVIQHIQNRREAELQFRILRQHKVAHRLELFHPCGCGLTVIAGGDHGQADAPFLGGPDQTPDRHGHAVDLIQGIGKQGDLLLCRRKRDLRQPLRYLANQFLAFMLVVKGQIVGRDQQMHQADGACRVEIIEKTCPHRK